MTNCPVEPDPTSPIGLVIHIIPEESTIQHARVLLHGVEECLEDVGLRFPPDRRLVRCRLYR